MPNNNIYLKLSLFSPFSKLREKWFDAYIIYILEIYIHMELENSWLSTKISSLEIFESI